MNIFTELLPARKSSKKSAIRFRPVEGDTPLAGVLTIHTDRKSADYTVEEFPSGWTQRGFTVREVKAGAENYTVYCRPGCPETASCTCKGHATALTCKHADAVYALVANGQL